MLARIDGGNVKVKQITAVSPTAFARVDEAVLSQRLSQSARAAVLPGPLPTKALGSAQDHRMQRVESKAEPPPKGPGAGRADTRDSRQRGAAVRRERVVQMLFPFARKRKTKRKARGKRGERRVPHGKRAPLSGREPVHVTLKLARGLPSLRRRPALRVLKRVLEAGNGRFGLRIVHFSAQSNHLHLIVEAPDRQRLARGMGGLAVRLARALNRLWERRGRVLADRYHDRVLRTPRAVRNALSYVLGNHRRHGCGEPGPDVYSSGAWFDGWTVCVRWLAERSGLCPVVASTTWLLTRGWRRHGRITFAEVGGAHVAR